MRSIFLICLSSQLLLFGAGGFEDTDFVPRLVNFSIFVFILYYLLFEKIKLVFSNRRGDIQKQLKDAENRLEQTRKQKSSALMKVSEAQKFAQEILERAKSESKLVSNEYNAKTAKILEGMNKLHSEKMEFQRRSLKNRIASELLDTFVDRSFEDIRQNKIVEILKSKACA